MAVVHGFRTNQRHLTAQSELILRYPGKVFSLCSTPRLSLWQAVQLPLASPACTLGLMECMSGFKHNVFDCHIDNTVPRPTRVYPDTG